MNADNVSIFLTSLMNILASGDRNPICFA